MKKFIVFLLTLLCLFTVSVSINNVVVEAVSSTYYSGTEDLTGTALLNKLTQITKKNHTYYTSYDDIKTMNHESDPDPNNPNNLLDFYSRISVPAKWDQGDTWNREHVWCQSLSGGLYGTSGAGSDIHHIRPTISSINSSRGNKKYTDFDLIPANGSENRYNGVLVAYDNSNYWEPLDNVKGDTARILMYMYMHYSKEVSANSSHSKAGKLSITNIVYGGGGADKAWDVLLYWNELDPVDTYESNRNEYCASVTGTRNPFIDYPEFATAIWGDGSSVKPDDNIGGGTVTPDQPSQPETPDQPVVSGSTATLVKSANDLKANDKIVIAATGHDYALGTTQNGNNRSRASITKSGTTLTFGSDTQIITLAKGTASNSYAFYVGDGYLYAAGGTGSKNYLRTQTSLTLAGSWNISIASSGSAKIVTADSSVQRNTLMYNTSAEIFSCYNGTQQDVSIYKIMDEHECEFSDDLKYNSTHHFYECECGKVENKVAHEFEWTQVSTATCTKVEVLSGECECGYKTTKNGVAALGHTEVVDQAVEATCTEPGLTEGKHCSVCNEVLVAQEEVPALGHSYDELECDETHHWYKCECGEASEKVAHNGGEATETEKAVCKDCGTLYGELKENTTTPETPEVDKPDTPEVDEPETPVLENPGNTIEDIIENPQDKLEDIYNEIAAGCAGSILTSLFGLLALTSATLVLRRKRKEK